jgi:predicted ribosomally synthesized peptide with SipW-like signal peptide
MTTKKKALAAIIAVCVIVCLTAGASLAYLTDTKTATNTFTVGKVNIKLTETGSDGKATEDGLTDLKLVPNTTTAKAPTVTVVKGSEPCYVRAKVKVTGISYFKNNIGNQSIGDALKELFVQGEASGWNIATNTDGVVVTEDTNKDEATITYYYSGIVNASEADVKIANPVFTAVKCPTWVTETTENANGDKAFASTFTVVVTAEAIQSAGFTDTEGGNSAEQNAWAAFDNQLASTPTTAPTTAPQNT